MEKNNQPGTINPLFPDLEKKKPTANKMRKMVKFCKIKRACLVFLFPKILILRFHMWSLDLLPVTGGICWKRLQAAEPTTRRGERGASRRRGRASALKQPLAGVRGTRRRWTRLPGAPQSLPLASTRSYAVMSRRRRAHESRTDPFTVITFKTPKKNI